MDSIFTTFANGAAFMFMALMSAYFFRRRRMSRINKILSWVLAVWAVVLFKDMLYWTDAARASSFTYRLLLMVDTLVTPFCAFYIFELLRPRSVGPLVVVTHVFPFVAFVVAFIVFRSETVYYSLLVFEVAYTLLCLSKVVVDIRRYNVTMLNYCSNLAGRAVNWLWLAIGILVCLVGLWCVAWCVRSFAYDIVYYVIVMIFWGVVGFFTLRHREMPSDALQDDAEPRLLRRHEPCVDVADLSFEAPLRKLFDEEDVASSDPNLTLNTLAIRLGTNRSYLSRYLNQSLGVTFYDFINSYRVYHAERLLADPRCALTLDQVAEASGFSSISTFRRAFAKKHGESPAAYRKDPGRQPPAMAFFRTA